jgi:hypothetical protein
MVFLGVFMMPFYYGSQARPVPEYLKLRFDEKTRGPNAISFATMTVFSSGISMYAMGLLLNLLLGWDFDTSVWLSAGVVLIYILLGGLTSAIYNEVLQFFLIVFGFAPLVFLGLKDLGGWQGLSARLTHVATAQGFAPHAWSSTWSQMGDATSNPMGVEWFGVAMGLDRHLGVQRVLRRDPRGEPDHAAAPGGGPGRTRLLPHTPAARSESSVVRTPGGARRGRARRDTDPQSALLVSLAWASTSAYHSD